MRDSMPDGAGKRDRWDHAAVGSKHMSIAPAWTPAEAPSRRSVIARLRRSVQAAGRAPSDALLGYDIFVSYSRRDALDYAKALVGALRAKGFRCFIDSGEMAGGEVLSASVERGLRRSRILVLVASRRALLESLYVRNEIGVFSSFGRPIIPVNVAGVLRETLPLSPLRGVLVDRIWVDDEASTLDAGPSPNVVAEIERSFAFVRRSRVRQAFATSLVIVFGLITAWALWQRYEAEYSRQRAELQRDAALRSQSRFLADRSRAALARQDVEAAQILALEALPAEPGAPGQRPLETAAVAALRQTLLERRHRFELRSPDTGPLTAARFSGDGKHVVTASIDGTAWLWDAVPGVQPRKFCCHGATVTDASISPDGASVLTATFDGMVSLWAADGSGVRFPPIRAQAGGWQRAAFSRDGQSFLTCAQRDGVARVWDSASGALRHELDGKAGWLQDCQWSPDGKRVVTAGSMFGTKPAIWDLSSPTPTHIPLPADGSGPEARFSPDGKLVATASSDGVVQLWDAFSGKEAGPPRKDPNGSAKGLAFSPDGRWLATISGNLVRVWQVGSQGEPVAVLDHRAAITQVAFSPDRDGARILTASEDGTLKLWDREKRHEPLMLRGHEGKVVAGSFSPDGVQVLSASRDGTARLWRVEPDQVVSVVPPPPGRHSTYGEWVLVEQERILTLSDSGTARLWSVPDGSVIKTIAGSGVATAAPAGNHFFLMRDGKTGEIRSGITGEVVATVGLGARAGAWSPTFSPRGDRLLTFSPRTLDLWDGATGALVAALSHPGSGQEATRGRFSPDGTRVVTSANNAVVQFWDAATGKPLSTLNAGGETVTDAYLAHDNATVLALSPQRRVTLFRPDGTSIAAELPSEGKSDVLFTPDLHAFSYRTNGGATIFANADHLEAVRELPTEGPHDRCLLAGCSLLMLASEGGRLRLVRASDGTDMGDLPGHTASLISVLPLPGDRLLTTSLDKTARLWDVRSQSVIATLASAPAGLRAAGLSRDGRRLLTVDGTGGARLWALWGDDPAELLRAGWSTLDRCLEPKERAENYLDPDTRAGADPSYCKRPAALKP